jgi:heme-degrading monooxygenase HmoA
MIIRIVKMVFKEEEIDSFKLLFDERKSLIRNFEGCTHLELWQDKTPFCFLSHTAGGILKHTWINTATLIFLTTPGH